MNESIGNKASKLIAMSVFVAFSIFYFLMLSKSESTQVGGMKINLSKQEGNRSVKEDDFWKRPEGPLRVGLQVGHWKNEELPDELERLRKRGGGSQGGGKKEWEVNLEIAKKVAKLLEDKGIVVDILPATVPEQYWADVVVAIHADGSEDPSTNGFKVAGPWRDITGKSSELANLIEQRYQQVTKMRIDPNVTRNMRGYYAFNWRRYRHSVHPMSTAVIIETGFLTNPSDRNILINKTSLVAEGISDALFDFFELS